MAAPRLLCVRFPHLGLVAAWRRHPELRAEPVVLSGRGPLQAVVVATSAAARSAGVGAGRPLRQARQLCPTAVVLPLDEAAVAELRDEVLAALHRVVPAVELGDDEAYCDLSGRHARFGDELAWAVAAARALTGALGDVDESAVAAGVAGSRLVAWVAAGRSRPRRVRRVGPGEEAAFLAPLPLGLLPGDEAILARLAALGIDRIGEVAALSPADLCRQFGEPGTALHRCARGEDGADLRPSAPPRTVAERLVLEGPVGDAEVLHHAARHLCTSLGSRLVERGFCAGRLALVLEGEAGTVAAASRVPPLPVGSPDELWPAVLGLLAAVTGGSRPQPGAPVVALRLVAGTLGAVAGRQVDMWHRGDAARDAVARTVARLDDRYGAGTVLRPRLALDPGDLPERRVAWVEAGAVP